MRSFALCDGFWRTGDEDFAAPTAAFRPQVDNPVSGFDHVEIVLNYHNGIALIAQFMQYVEQLLNIGEVQTGSRLVENIQRLPGAAF
ncbi:Uncharacterised protein [Escherichia coli]|nr:Uncharacterised protein [Escherichia coli]